MKSRVHDRRARWCPLGLIAATLALGACGSPNGPSELADEQTDSIATPEASNASLSVELSPLAGATGQIEYRLTNTSPEPVRFFAWQTAANGGLVINLFDVRRDGEAVEFAGPHVHLAAPDPDAFTELAPGATLTTVLRLPDYYAMDRSGTYSIQARAVAPAVLQAGETLAPATLSVPASSIVVDVDEDHVYHPAEDVVEKASSICRDSCLVQCGAQPSGCATECIANFCDAKITGCSANDKQRLETAEDNAAGRANRSLSGLNSGTAFTTEFGARNTGKINLVRSVLNKIIGDLPRVPYRCNAASTVVGPSPTPGVDFVCAPRTNFSQIEVNAATTRSAGARVQVCPTMFSSAATTAGIMVHESSHHFGTIDGDANPLNNPEAYRRYVMAF